MANNIEIKETKTYGQFKLMKGNRTVNKYHVKNLIRSIKENPELLSREPILVNKELFVIDGQHRLAAATELKVPIYYMVDEEGSLDITRKLNSTQLSWTLEDFATSYAETGNEDYATVLKYARKYPRISLSVIIVVLAGGQLHGLSTIFRRGDFTISDEKEAEFVLARIAKIIDTMGWQSIRKPMAVSLMRVFKNEDFDFDKFISKLELHEKARKTLTTASVGLTSECLRGIESAYNHQSPSRTILF